MAKDAGGGSPVDRPVAAHTRDELDGRLHFWHDALGFLHALQAALAEPFVLGNRTNLLDVRLDISAMSLAVSDVPALRSTKW